MARINKEKNNQNNEPLEKKLWKAADKLRKNMDAAERFNTLKAELEKQIAEEAELNKAIMENLTKLEIAGK